jgi:predicted nuclease of predicted toxin-antitoxin system
VADGVVRLYIDECVHSRVAESLRNSGVDAVGAHEVDNFRLSDTDQLKYAASEGRALVTYNSGDFAVLHRKWMAAGWAHAGLLLSPRDYKHAVGELVRDLLATLEHHAALHDEGDWPKNQLIWIRPAR